MTIKRLFFPLFAALSLVVLAGCGGGKSPTDDDVKTYVTRKENLLAGGSLTSPKTVSVTFDEIQIGKSRAADQRDRLVNGAKADTMFPVRVRYTSHRTWGNGQTEDVTIHYSYDFYVDEFGAWTAIHNGPVR